MNHYWFFPFSKKPNIIPLFHAHRNKTDYLRKRWHYRVAKITSRIRSGSDRIHLENIAGVPNQLTCFDWLRIADLFLLFLLVFIVFTCFYCFYLFLSLLLSRTLFVVLVISSLIDSLASTHSFDVIVCFPIMFEHFKSSSLLFEFSPLQHSLI